MRKGGTTIEVMQLVDQLEELLVDSRRIPGTSTLLINEDEFLRIVDQLRVWVPDELKQAQRIRQERDRIIDQASREAQRIVAEARSAPGSVSVPPVTIKPAAGRSRSLIVEAEREAQELREGAQRYAKGSMEQLRQQLQGLLEQVNRGLAHLDSTTRDGGGTR